MSLFNYVCMYVCMHVCMYVLTYVCTNVCMRVCMNACMCIKYACNYVYLCIYTCIFMPKWCLICQSGEYMHAWFKSTITRIRTCSSLYNQYTFVLKSKARVACK